MAKATANPYKITNKKDRHGNSKGKGNGEIQGSFTTFRMTTSNEHCK
jgi:hypothetical protein